VNDKTEVRIRRAPKLSVFLVIGAFVGALVTLILTSQFKADPAVGFAATAGYFLLFGIPAGVALGAAVGLIIDRVSIARARTITVEHEVVASTPLVEDALVEPVETPEPKKKRTPRVDP
jgi:NhaP-type Na+/H+ or K+/H+ antiporter